MDTVHSNPNPDSGNRIRHACSFEELYAILREIKEVPGRLQVYTAEQLIDYIENLRVSAHSSHSFLFKLNLRRLTSTYELRERVSFLLLQERRLGATNQKQSP